MDRKRHEDLMIGIRVPKHEANRIRLILREKSLLHRQWKIMRSDDYVYLPLVEKPDNNLLDALGLSEGAVVDTEFEEVVGPRSMEDYLQNRIPPEKMEDVKKSFDIIGGVVILEIPPELEEEKMIIGEAALNFTKRNAIYRKKSEIRGVTRTRELEFLAGEDQPVTVHKEYGSRFMVDVKKVYFSPRLATERKIVADQVCNGEVIIDMFCGVGPFAIGIARQQPNVCIYAVDINPHAIHYLKENIKLNKVDGKIKPILGDVKQVLRDLDIQADRIIMNLPEKAYEYLILAIEHLKKGGVIHYYQFSRDFDEPIRRVKEAAYPCQVKVMSKRKVKSRSPGVWHVGIDLLIQ